MTEHHYSNIYLKLENSQPSGSFKNRGIGAFALANFERLGSSAKLVCSSGGNAGLACAYAAHALGMRSTIFVPATAKPDVIKRIEGYGAEVVQGGAHWFEADTAARKLVESDEQTVYVPPFDHPAVIEGHSTIVSEIEEQLREQGVKKADALICSVGGGGLLAGILLGMENSKGLLNVPVLACETSGAASFRQSLRASYSTSPPVKKMERLAAITSIASTLGATMVSEQVIDSALRHSPGVASVVLEDQRAVEAMRFLIDDHAFFVEPACAAALIPAYAPDVLQAALPDIAFGASGVVPAKDAPTAVIILCGGNTVTLERFLAWQKEYEDAPLGPLSVFDGSRSIDVEW